MSVSHKYKTFNQLLDDVSVDFSNYAMDGMLEPQQLIKVATRINYDLGLKINRTKQIILDVEHSKAKLPWDFAFLNYAFICGEYTVRMDMPSGTHVDTTNPVPYVPDPGFTGPCADPTCSDVCVITPCENSAGYQVVQKVGNLSQYRTYSTFRQLRINTVNSIVCDCPNVNVQSPDIAEIREGFLLTNFPTGKVFMSYQGAMEDNQGNLLVLDHPYCNEYYEYGLKQRILENMIFAGENVANQLSLIEQRYRVARVTALSFVNTPDFAEMRRVWDLNRRAQYHKYYDMFTSHPPNSNRYGRR